MNVCNFKKSNKVCLFDDFRDLLNRGNNILKIFERLIELLMQLDIKKILGTESWEHDENRTDFRNGYRTRRVDMQAGTINVRIPRLRNSSYIPSYFPSKTRFNDALISMIQDCYIGGLSTRKLVNIAKTLGIENISPAEVSNIVKKLDPEIEAFRQRKIEAVYPILFVDSLYEKIVENNKSTSKAVMIVQGINSEGKRQILSVEVMDSETEENYTKLFISLKNRGLNDCWLIVSDANIGLRNAIANNFPNSRWQRCLVHFKRNILDNVKVKNRKEVAKDLREIWQAPNREKAIALKNKFVEKYSDIFPKAVDCLEEGFLDSLQFYNFSEILPAKINNTNSIERVNEEIRRRTKPIRLFPNINSCLRIITSYLIELSEDWDNRFYISAERMKAQAEKLEKDLKQ